MMTKSPPKKTYVEEQKIYFNIVSTSQLILAGIVFLLTQTLIKKQNDHSLLLALSIAVSIVTVMGVAMSYVMFSAKLNSARTKETLKAKLEEYRIAFILRSALLLFPAFLSIMSGFITGSTLFLQLFVIIYLIQLRTRPSSQKISKQLELSEEETSLINSIQ
jgi:amino acid transporter